MSNIFLLFDEKIVLDYGGLDQKQRFIQDKNLSEELKRVVFTCKRVGREV